jgi:hypothetical protein
MAEQDRIRILVEAEVNKAVADLNKVSNSAEGVEKKVGGMSGAFSSFKGLIAGAVVG